jgi:hypothetical protein
MRLRRFAIAVFLANSCLSSQAAEPTVQPVPSVQQEIGSCLSRLVFLDTEKELNDAIRSVESTVAKCGLTSAGLVEQIIYYGLHNNLNEEKGYGMILLINRIHIDPVTKIRTAVPYLDIPDRKMRKVPEGFVQTADTIYTSDTDRIDLSIHERILRERKKDVPFGLVRYIFRRAPELALLSMTRVYGEATSETAFAAKLKGKPTKEGIAYFAARPEWWARLYAAAKMRDSDLRNRDLILRLYDDKHPLVRAVATEAWYGE